MRSEPLGPQQGVGQVKQQACGDESRRANNRRSWSFSSKPFAGVGVAYARHEEAEAERQHDDVQHEVLLCAMFGGAKRNERSRLSRVLRCHPPHRFSRWEQRECYRNLIRATPYWRRPGQALLAREPGSITTAMLIAEGGCHPPPPKSRGVWVPAFAGTTWKGAPRPAGTYEILYFGASPHLVFKWRFDHLAQCGRSSRPRLR